VQYAKHTFYDTNSHILFLFHQMAFVYGNKNSTLAMILWQILGLKTVGYCDNNFLELLYHKIKTYNDCTNRKHPTNPSSHCRNP